MFAIIKTGGKQYLVRKDTEIFVEKLEGEENDEIIFDQVNLVDDKIGTPYVKGAKVKAKILKHGKEKKIIVFKYKPKKNSKTKYGHRQPYTKLVITDIIVGAKKSGSSSTNKEKK